MTYNVFGGTLNPTLSIYQRLYLLSSSLCVASQLTRLLCTVLGIRHDIARVLNISEDSLRIFCHRIRQNSRHSILKPILHASDNCTLVATTPTSTFLYIWCLSLLVKLIVSNRATLFVCLLQNRLPHKSFRKCTQQQQQEQIIIIIMSKFLQREINTIVLA